MQLSPHFSLEEFTVTQHRGIDNSLPETMLEEAKRTCEMLERIRIFLSIQSSRQIKIFINSGFRCRQLNAAVGGQQNSDHLRAMAVDWIAPKFGTPAEIAKLLAKNIYNLNIGQLIREYASDDGGGWVHTSTKIPMHQNNRIITIDKNGVRMGV